MSEGSPTLRARVRVGGRALAARAVSVVALAAYIGAVYVVVVLGGGLFVGGDGPSTVLTIAAAAAVAVSFGRVRVWALGLADRLVPGTRTTALETLNQFSQGVAGAYGADQVLSRMARTLVEGTGARRAEVWVVVGDHLRRAGIWPTATRALEAPPLRPLDDWPGSGTGIDLCVPVRPEEGLLGLLALQASTGRPFTAAEEALVTDLASHASLVIQNVRLSAELAERTDDLAAQAAALQDSRRRLIAARTAERRRVERNIHDGAQQHLVALLVRIGLVPVLAESDQKAASGELAGLADLCDEALMTLADLARGLHPRELTEAGLGAALASRTLRMPTGIDARVESSGVRRYTPDVEAAAYFACLEAMQNAVKYAACSEIVVRLHDTSDGLDFAVADDGRGFDGETSLGAGLANMTDRVEALNGRLSVISEPGQGTTVSGHLPQIDPRPTSRSPSLTSPS